MNTKTVPQLPNVLGEFEILEPLAATDMASIFKGRHIVSGEVVAIKMASKSVLEDPVLLSRFDQEFTVTRNLDHPNLVRALRFGHEGDLPYIVLEFVDGLSLGSRIKQQGRLAEAEAVRIISQVGEALHYAHINRIVHRDVKPDNILLTPEGQAKLADLGLAKDCDSESYLTRPSIGLGTPYFMAPEQFRDAKNADRRCDVYSLGATLYTAITGQMPFRAKGALGILEKKMANDIVTPRKYVSVLSPWVESTILRSVDVNPQARPSSCLQFIEELSGKHFKPEAAAVAPSAKASSSNKDQDKGSRSERRATVRFPSRKGTSCQPLRGEKERRWKATIQDVSADGIGLIVSRRFEIRTVLNLEIPATDEQPLRRMLVRVVRVVAMPAKHWLLGCVFASRIDDEEAQAIC